MSKPKQTIKWQPLSADELSIIHDLDNMDRPMGSVETKFLSDIITQLDRRGEYRANFSTKQRDWLKRLANKYLE